MEDKTPLIEDWPKVSWAEIAKQEVEGKIVKVFYKTFFAVLLLPERLASGILTVLKHAGFLNLT